MTAQTKVDLRGRRVVITRPVGMGAAQARQVRRAGGVPVLLPGLALRADGDAATHAALCAALGDAVLLFTSPAAVHFAARLLALRTRATVLAVGQGTASALRRHGVAAPLVPAQANSEGLLAHPALADVAGRRVAMIGVPGGRGVLPAELLRRGADLRQVHVYHRTSARLDRRHLDAMLALPADACSLISSGEALANLCRQLPAPALQRWLASTAVVSSERLAATARAAGFARVVVAASALSSDLIAAAAR